MFRPQRVLSLLVAFCFVPKVSPAPPIAIRPVDEVLNSYIAALGGQAAVDRVETRQIEAKEGHGPKLMYFWRKPNKVLLIQGKQRIGYDGGSGWMLSSKKRVTRLSRGAEKPLEIAANPIRFAHLKTLYSEIEAKPPEVLDGSPADVLQAPNDLGASKFYFDRGTHLLVRMIDKGETSAYYRYVIDFSDYQEVDGVKLPFLIASSSDEPGFGNKTLKFRDVQQNLPLQATIFSRPSSSGVVLGGKR